MDFSATLLRALADWIQATPVPFSGTWLDRERSPGRCAYGVEAGPSMGRYPFPVWGSADFRFVVVRCDTCSRTRKYVALERRGKKRE